MAAKGSIAKTEIIDRILEQYSSNSFSPDGKEIRIDMIENGQPIQIKVVLTAVKIPISNSPKSNITNEEQKNSVGAEFSISDEDRDNLQKTLDEMGVSF